MSYNLSFMDNSTNLLHVVQGVNNLASNWLGTALLMIVFIGLITFYVSKNNEFGKSLILASFITTLVGGLLFFVSFVAWYIAIIPIIALIVSIVVEFFG